MQGWFDRPPTEKSKIKCRKAFIAFIAIFACMLVATVVLGIVYPRMTRIKEIDNTRFIVANYEGTDEWFYTTEENVVRLNKSDDVLEVFPLVKKAKERGIDVGKIRGIHLNEDSEYMWAVTSASADENRGYIFKMKNSPDGLEILETADFSGVYYRMVVSDDYFYIISAPDASISVLGYDANAISEGVKYQGVLYEGTDYDGKVEIAPISATTILTAEFIDGYLYVLYSSGIIRMEPTLSQNSYRYSYWALKDQGYTSEEACAELGIEYYDEGTNEVSVLVDNFDYSKYCLFLHDGFVARGGAYVEEQSTFYFITDDAEMRALDFTVFDDGTDLWDYARMEWFLEDESVSDVVLYAKPASTSSSLIYSKYSKKGYIIYEAENKISCIDFSDGARMEFTINAEFDIVRVFQIDERLYYSYSNRFQTERADQTILANVNIASYLKKPIFTAGITTSVIIGLLAGVCALIAAICWKKEGSIAKFKLLLKRIIKNKWVYISMIPSLILLVSFCYYPAVESIRLSFFEYSVVKPTMRWNNFENYRLIFTNDYTREMFENMFLYLFTDIITAIGPPLLFAFFLTVMRNKGYSKLMRTMLFIPGVIPGIAGLLIWRVGVYEGVLPAFLKLFTDTPHVFLESYKTTRFELLIMGFPYVGAYLIFYGGMMNIPTSYYEAAELEGVGIWKRFFFIDVPLVFPQIKYVFVMNFIGSVQNFARIDSVTGGLKGTRTPIVEIYSKIHSDMGAYGEASAYATLMFIFLFFATALNLRKTKKDMEV